MRLTLPTNFCSNLTAVGLSRAAWSTDVAAWTNASGEQVAFTPYANATVKDASTISIAGEISAGDITIETDGDVSLNGAGNIGGVGAIVKNGTGVFAFNATGGLDAQPIIVSNGVFKVGDDLTGNALGASADTSPVVVTNGGVLQIEGASGTWDVPNGIRLRNGKLIAWGGETPTFPAGLSVNVESGTKRPVNRLQGWKRQDDEFCELQHEESEDASGG